MGFIVSIDVYDVDILNKFATDFRLGNNLEPLFVVNRCISDLTHVVFQFCTVYG